MIIVSIMIIKLPPVEHCTEAENDYYDVFLLDLHLMVPSVALTNDHLVFTMEYHDNGLSENPKRVFAHVATGSMTCCWIHIVAHCNVKSSSRS